MTVACHAALAACKARGQAPTDAVMERALDGNLCRCTGYRPILDACKVTYAPVDSVKTMAGLTDEGVVDAVVGPQACVVTCMPRLNTVRRPNVRFSCTIWPCPFAAGPCACVKHSAH